MTCRPKTIGVVDVMKYFIIEFNWDLVDCVDFHLTVMPYILIDKVSYTVSIFVTL